MYHPIHPPDCTARLGKLIQLARLTLAFGLERERSIDVTRNRPDVRREVRPDFLAYLEAKGRRRAGEWLWQKWAIIADPVIELLALPLSAKQGILEAFDADVDLEARFEEGHFHFPSIPATSDQAMRWVRAILSSFYQDILADGNGVPAGVLGDTEGVSRQDVLRGYLRANRHLLVCPGCDGSPPSLADGVVHADCDHFFPKHKYHFLTVHALNLTPYCRDCNQSFKGKKDALEAPDVANLDDVYHPYLRPARCEVAPTIERDAADGQPHIHLRASTSAPQGHARLNSLNYVLDLEARWDGDLAEDRLAAHLESVLRHASQDDRETGFHPNDEWFQRKLDAVVANMPFDVGRQVGAVPALAYARWVAQDARAREEWVQDRIPHLWG